MRSVDWVVIAYLAYVAVLAWFWPMGRRARLAITITAMGDTALIAWLAGRPLPGATPLRDWLPALQILIAYWLSGPFFVRPMPALERWLRSSDRWWFEVAGLGWFANRGPRLILELLELAYTSAYVMVPLGFALVWSTRAVDADRYWTPVVLAELVCYGMLPWIRARTPEAIGDHIEINRRPVALRRLNRGIQTHGSIRVATIPSGHAAGALATALTAGTLAPPLLAPLLLLTLLIALGSVVGRYHYAVDAILGFAVGVMSVALP
jgi:hypothetical protein